jgi:hypothetical protein
MPMINMFSIYKHAETIVAREIEGELLIIPLSSGVGNMEEELYSLNESGKAIWNLMDGSKSLSQIVTILQEEFDAPAMEISEDVESLISELLTRNIVTEVL